MTRRERDKLAELLEAVAAELDAAAFKATTAAAASGLERAEGHAYRVGHLESCTRTEARRIRALVAEFLAPRAKGKAA